MSRGSKLWVLALGALVSAAAAPSSAQVVVGGSTGPDVQVNWGVLDRLGPQPTLPGMLRTELRPPQAQAPAAHAGKGVHYKPYKAVAAPAPRPAAPKKPRLAAAEAPKAPAKAATTKPAPTKPAVAEVAELAQVARGAAVPEVPMPKVAPAPAKPAAPDVPADVPLPPKVEAPKPNKVKAPEVALPSAPTPAPAPAPAVPPIVEAKPEPVKPVQLAPEPPKPATPQIAKVEAPPPPPPPPPAVALPAPPPTAPVAAPAPAPAPQQVANVPSGAAFVRKGDTLSVMFSGENARLPDQAKPELDRLAARMEKDDALSLQLMAYAEGDEANASKARRLSLSRALEVRKYLMELGVRSTRIEVRALGNKIEGGPGDRVDAVLAGR